MRYNDLFLKTQKTSAKDESSINAILLQRGGFIDKTMAGVYTYLPLGLRVLTNIENIVREEMNKLGTEILMPALAPKALWQQTERLEAVDVLLEARGANELSRQRNDASYILNPTHEEVLTPIAQHIKLSYKELPFAVYQIQTKFRNEERPKSGLLRGREFRMKDLYSFHATEDDFKQYYERVKEAYTTIFDRLGIGGDTHLTVASGGAFTNDFSHEFDTVCDTGEDTIFYDEKTSTYYNKEVTPPEVQKRGVTFKASEVGNIFPLGTRFSDAFGYRYLDAQGQQQPPYMGSYGLGTSRAMGVIVEKMHDERGIIWPESIAPFQAHLIALNHDAEKVYQKLQEAGIDVLFDDRAEASAGQKLSDADLIGIPWRVIVSKKTGDNVEVKRRQNDKAELKTLDQLLATL